LYYEWHHTVPATSSEKDKEHVEIEPGGEILKRVEVDFPVGCYGLVRSQLLQGGFQVHPANPQGYVAGNGVRIVADMHYDMTKNAGQWYWDTWSTSCAYGHELTLAMTTFERWELLVRLDSASIVDLFKGQGVTGGDSG